GRRDHARNVEIAVARRGPDDADVVVGEPRVQALAVRLQVDRHRFDAQLFARTDHPQGDLPAVRDQYLLEHIRPRGRRADRLRRWSRRTPGSALTFFFQAEDGIRDPLPHIRPTLDVFSAPATEV